jgi:hypothetical protein
MSRDSNVLWFRQPDVADDPLSELAREVDRAVSERVRLSPAMAGGLVHRFLTKIADLCPGGGSWLHGDRWQSRVHSQIRRADLA